MNVLVVAMIDSIHTARWISQFESTGVRFTIFPSTPSRKTHYILKKLHKIKGQTFVSLRLIDRITAFPFGAIDLFLGRTIQAWRLHRLLENKKFDAIHILETQHAGYLFLRATRSMLKLPPVALSIWGSDLSYYSRMENHRISIRKVLQKVDLLFIECDRDQMLAIELGFKGRFTTVIPASGGLLSAAELELEKENKPASERKEIVVKGYSGFVGRAGIALRAIEENANLLTNFVINVYSASLMTSILVWRMRRRTGLAIHRYRKKSLSHFEVLQMFREARLSISVSLSDGLPGSYREAVWAGAFPIESKGSCVQEWAISESDCIVVDPKNVVSVSRAIALALQDDQMVDQAQINNRLLAARFTSEKVREICLVHYRELMNISLEKL